MADSDMELARLVALNMAGSIGYVTCRRLVERFGSTEGAFSVSATELARVSGIRTKTAEKIKSLSDLTRARVEIEGARGAGFNIIAVTDENYPELLRRIYDPPVVLYADGELEAADDFSVAIVGSRRPTAYGVKQSERFGRLLAEAGVTVVSGMARGIDSAAHRSTLLTKGRTIAVLGCGLDVVYPPENERLRAEIADGGAVVSEFPLGTGPRSYNFPRRNRIISGMSRGVLVVEAPERSGALITASWAAEQGRDVFALPGRADSLSSAGTNKLIKDGAKLVVSVSDILEEYVSAPDIARAASVEAGTTAPGLFHDDRVDSGPAIKLDDSEKKILAHLSIEPVDIETLIEKTDTPPADLHTGLLKLQIKGLIKQFPGMNYALR